MVYLVENFRQYSRASVEAENLKITGLFIKCSLLAAA